MAFCLQCGQKLPDESRFCNVCGAPQAAPEPAPAAIVPAPVAPAAVAVAAPANHAQEIDFLFQARALELFLIEAARRRRELEGQKAFTDKPPEVYGQCYKKESFKRNKWAHGLGNDYEHFDFRNVDFFGKEGRGIEFSESKRGETWYYLEITAGADFPAFKMSRPEKRAFETWNKHSERVEVYEQKLLAHRLAWLEGAFEKCGSYYATREDFRKMEEYKAEYAAWKKAKDVDHPEFVRTVLVPAQEKLQQGMDEARQALKALYTAARLLPQPYQYAEAVCYLYDFLSTAPDDYDIKYALERLDFAEMKQQMTRMIQNQGKMLLMQSIQIAQQAEANAELRSIQRTQNDMLSDSRQFLVRADRYMTDVQRFVRGQEVYGTAY